MARNILVCTVGASWAVVPEVFGFVAPDLLALYEHHPQRSTLESSRRDHALQSPDELWLITTAGKQTEHSIRCIERWWQLLGWPMPMRVWVAEIPVAKAHGCRTATDPVHRQSRHLAHDFTGRVFDGLPNRAGGLTLWEALILMRQAFERSFLPAPVRSALMHAADAAVIRALDDADWMADPAAV